MNTDTIISLVRQILLFGGGIAVGKGWLTSDQMTWIVGGLITLATSGWAFWSNRPAGLLAKAANLPQVEAIKVAPTSSLADKVASAKVQ